MSRKKELSSYPTWMLEVAQAAFNQQAIPALSLADRAAAISTRHSFNRFRNQLAAEGHPHSDAVIDLIVRVEREGNTWQLQFVARGLWKNGLMGGKRPTLVIVDDIHEVPNVAPFPPEASAASATSGPVAESEDPFEKLVKERILGQEPEKTKDCQHEADAMETRCVKCGLPVLKWRQS